VVNDSDEIEEFILNLDLGYRVNNGFTRASIVNRSPVDLIQGKLQMWIEIAIRCMI